MGVTIFYTLRLFLDFCIQVCDSKKIFLIDKTCVQHLRYGKIHNRNTLTPILSEENVFFVFEVCDA